MLNDTIIIGIIAASTTILALFGKLLYSSKCDVIKFCCCEIHRQVSQEMPANTIEHNATAAPTVQEHIV